MLFFPYIFRAYYLCSSKCLFSNCLISITTLDLPFIQTFLPYPFISKKKKKKCRRKAVFWLCLHIKNGICLIHINCFACLCAVFSALLNSCCKKKSLSKTLVIVFHLFRWRLTTCKDTWIYISEQIPALRKAQSNSNSIISQQPQPYQPLLAEEMSNRWDAEFIWEILQSKQN